MPYIPAKQSKPLPAVAAQTLDGLGAAEFGFALVDPVADDYSVRLLGRLCSAAVWSPSDRDAAGPVAIPSLAAFVAQHGPANADLAPAVAAVRSAVAAAAKVIFRIKGLSG